MMSFSVQLVIDTVTIVTSSFVEPIMISLTAYDCDLRVTELKQRLCKSVVQIIKRKSYNDNKDLCAPDSGHI